MSSGHIYTGSHRSLIYTVSLILNPSQICHLNIFTLMYIHYKNLPNTFPEIPNLHICSYLINLKNFKEKIILTSVKSYKETLFMAIATGVKTVAYGRDTGLKSEWN